MAPEAVCTVLDVETCAMGMPVDAAVAAACASASSALARSTAT
jgi:hypothetical protein